MTRTQRWTAGTALVVVLALVAGWLLLVSPKRAEADSLQAQAAQQQQQNAALQSQIAQLKAQQAQLPAKQAELATIRQQIPQTPAMPALVRSLASIANGTGVLVKSVIPSTPGEPTTTGTTQTATTVKGPDGSVLEVISVTMEVDGTYYNVERFLSRLESLKRAFLVTGFTLTVGTDSAAVNAPTSAVPAVGQSPTLKATINARVFMTAVPKTTTAAPGTPAK
jgi:type II secretory pathway pseudopilin PulG